ncbi:MAG: hypothetical protein ACO21G_05755, partial [Algoriphagus sp.]
KTDFFGNHVDIASVRVNVSPEKHKGIDMKNPFCFEPMTLEQFIDVHKGLTRGECLVLKALNESIICWDTWQTDLVEAFDKVKGHISPDQFGDICESLANKNLYRYIICESHNHPKKVIFFEGKRREIRQDVAKVFVLKGS